MGDVVKNVFCKRQTQILRNLAANPNCSLRWSDQAIEELAVGQGLTGEDLRESMTNCHVVLEEKTNDEVFWMIEGADVDGAEIKAVVVPYEFEIAIKIVCGS